MEAPRTAPASTPPRFGFSLTAAERGFFAPAESASVFPFQATPFLLSRIDPDDPADPIRRQIVPTEAELATAAHEKDDPLCEARFTVAPALVRRYADRCIFKVTDACAVHCRFCFRKGLLGTDRREVRDDEVRGAARYLSRHPEIREVLLTGGDPLTLAPERLEAVMAVIRESRSDVSFRIGTRLPMADPERLSDGLAALLARFRPLWLTVHCNHPVELSPPVLAALARLTSRGLRLGGQSVLLAGINDDADTLGELFAAQEAAGLRPYYLFHLDPAPGTSHFRVPMRRGLELLDEVRRRRPGVHLPVYAVDLPDGGGKVPVASLGIEKGDGKTIVIRTLEGLSCSIPD
jgi:lysine 2,3-aminomutase